MEEISREEFLRQKADAERRMKELYGGHSMPPYPGFVSLTGNAPKASQAAVPPREPKSDGKPQKPAVRPASNGNTPSGFAAYDMFRFLNLPELLKSQDTLLILGLIFLLMSDNADEKLILALVFIML